MRLGQFFVAVRELPAAEDMNGNWLERLTLEWAKELGVRIEWELE
jgi:hypothetical protein